MVLGELIGEDRTVEMVAMELVDFGDEEGEMVRVRVLGVVVEGG